MKLKSDHKEKVLIILGMHRSGTSLLTNWISKMGLCIGLETIKGDLGNVNGYFEDIDFHNFHESVFKKNKIGYGGLNFPLDFELDYEDKKSLERLIVKKKKENKEWGWKDPRTCLFLDSYNKNLPDAKYLILYRDCDSVVDSLIRRDKSTFRIRFINKSILNRIVFPFIKKDKFKEIEDKNVALYQEIWSEYNRKVLNHIKIMDPSNYMVINIKDVIHNDKELCSYLVNSWEFDLSYLPFNEVYDHKLFNSKENVGKRTNNSNSIEDEFLKFNFSLNLK